jgi:hypothetical protein
MAKLAGDAVEGTQTALRSGDDDDDDDDDDNDDDDARTGLLGSDDDGGQTDDDGGVDGFAGGDGQRRQWKDTLKHTRAHTLALARRHYGQCRVGTATAAASRIGGVASGSDGFLRR